MESQQEGMDKKSLIDLLGMVGSIGTMGFLFVGTLSWIYMQNMLNITSLKGNIDFNILEFTTEISIVYILLFCVVGMVMFGTPWFLKRTLLMEESLYTFDRNYLRKLGSTLFGVPLVYMVLILGCVRDGVWVIALAGILSLIASCYILWSVSFKRIFYEVNVLMCFGGLCLFIFLLLLSSVLVLYLASGLLVKSMGYCILGMGFIVGWLFYLVALLNEKQQLNTWKDKISFLGIFFIVIGFVLIAGLGKDLGYFVYSQAGIIQTAKDTQTYQIRQSFFDEHVTHQKLIESLLENKNIVLSESEKLNYFNKPIKAFLGWSRGDMVVLCEPRQGDKLILLNCETGEGLDLSKGLVINRQFLQRLSQ